MSSGEKHSEEGPLQSALTHFYVGVVLGLMTIVVTALLQWLAPISALDHLGEDQVQRIYAGGRPHTKAKPLVLLDINFANPTSGETGRLADAVSALIKLKPHAIIIDQQVSDVVPTDVAEKFLDSVKAAAAADIRVVLVPWLGTASRDGTAPIPILPGWVNQLRGTPDVSKHSVVIASPVVYPDPDGVIRSFPRADCFVWLQDEAVVTILPTIATSLDDTQPTACGRGRANTKPIQYAVSPADVGKSRALKLISMGEHGLILMNDLGDPNGLYATVHKRIVLIGETTPSNWGDMHRTPLGEMPGVLIHANSLLSNHDSAFNWLAFLFGLTASGVLGAFAILPWFWLRAAIQRETHALPRPAWPGVRVLLLLILVAIVMPLCVGGFEAAEAEPLKFSMELAGVLIASALFALQGYWAPRFSRTLGLTHDFGWLLSFGFTAVVIVFLLTMFWFIVGSLLLTKGLRVASLVPVLATSAEALVKAGQHVTELIHKWLRALSIGAAVVLVLGSLAGVPRAVAAPPSQAASEDPPNVVVRSLQAFRELLLGSSTLAAPQLLAGERNRGSGFKQALRWLPAVPTDGAFLPTASLGLCVVWTGGTPPFVVSLTTSGGDALGAVRADARVAQFPSFRMPDEPVSVVVDDAQDHEISAVLRPASSAPPAAAAAGNDPATATALMLFVEGGPTWRMEALRRLAQLVGTDPNARRALGDLRRAADGAP